MWRRGRGWEGWRRGSSGLAGRAHGCLMMNTERERVRLRLCVDVKRAWRKRGFRGFVGVVAECMVIS